MKSIYKILIVAILIPFVLYVFTLTREPQLTVLVSQNGTIVMRGTYNSETPLREREVWNTLNLVDLKFINDTEVNGDQKLTGKIDVLIVTKDIDFKLSCDYLLLRFLKKTSCFYHVKDGELERLRPLFREVYKIYN